MYKIPLPKVRTIKSEVGNRKSEVFKPRTPHQALRTSHQALRTPLIPQRLVRLQHVLNAFERLLFAAKAQEGFSFDIQ